MERLSLCLITRDLPLILVYLRFKLDKLKLKLGALRSGGVGARRRRTARVTGRSVTGRLAEKRWRGGGSEH
jgi:hypothetical protein